MVIHGFGGDILQRVIQVNVIDHALWNRITTAEVCDARYDAIKN